jgi:hypothetical protein
MNLHSENARDQLRADRDGATERWKAEAERFRAALEQIAADYISPPCTVAEGAAYLAVEFKRRWEIAIAALDRQPPQGKAP